MSDSLIPMDRDALRSIVEGAVTAERERCAKIADAVALAAEKAAQYLSYGELYGEQCKTEAAQEIAKYIRAG